MTVQKPIRPDVLQGLLPGGQERERLYKLAATEAAHGLEGATYDNMVAGIVDTVLNRVASGDWGKNVRDVANAPNQFSAINGPRGRGYTVYGDVDAVPDSVVPAKLREAVDEHLDARLKGAPSIVGDAMNYANPNFSDAKNMGWINALDGPTFGSGNAVHVHGTVAGTQAVEAVLNASKEFINGVEAKESYYAALKGLLAPEKAEELQGFVNSATGAKAHGLQTGISYLMGKVKLTDGELTQAGVNMAAYREERGILPKEDRDRLSDQDVAKGIEDGKYIKDGDGNLVVAHVDHKNRIRQSGHVLNATNVFFKFFKLAHENKLFFFGHGVKTHFLLRFHILQTFDGSFHCLKVGQHAAQPTLIDKGHTCSLCFRRNDFASLSLGAHHQNGAAVSCQLLGKLQRVLEHR